MSDTISTADEKSAREYPSLENVALHPTFRGWEPTVVPMPRKRKLAEPDPFFALAAQHRTLYAKKRPLERAAWKTRDLPAEHHRRKSILAALDDLDAKISPLEDEMIKCVATTPSVLIEQINVFRDWVDLRREAMVDAVIAGLRAALAAGGAA
jgi:hypothetical protein